MNKEISLKSLKNRIKVSKVTQELVISRLTMGNLTSGKLSIITVCFKLLYSG